MGVDDSLAVQSADAKNLFMFTGDAEALASDCDLRRSRSGELATEQLRGVDWTDTLRSAWLRWRSYHSRITESPQLLPLKVAAFVHARFDRREEVVLLEDFLINSEASSQSGIENDGRHRCLSL
jgi:hypothetical protein